MLLKNRIQSDHIYISTILQKCSVDHDKKNSTMLHINVFSLQSSGTKMPKKKKKTEDQLRKVNCIF